jgi:cyclin B
MNDSLNSLDKSTNKKEDPEIIFKIVKINKKKINNNFKDEYLDEIYQNLILDEKLSNLKINCNYMKNQIYINDQMRAILVDWLIEVHQNFKFQRNTLFQTIYIIDLYLSYEVVYKEHFQLLGIASLLISAKENEVVYPSLEKFIGITDNAYNKSELLKMEIQVLQALNFEVIIPTTEEYYNILSKIFNFNKSQNHLGEYFLDSALVDYNMLKYKYSTIGLACIYIVMKFYGLNGYKDLYSSKLIMGFSSQKTIKDCAKELCFLVKNLSKSNLKAAKEKYSSEEYDNVARYF